jgi:hypothetical protein
VSDRRSGQVELPDGTALAGGHTERGNVRPRIIPMLVGMLLCAAGLVAVLCFIGTERRPSGVTVTPPSPQDSRDLALDKPKAASAIPEGAAQDLRKTRDVPSVASQIDQSINGVVRDTSGTPIAGVFVRAVAGEPAKEGKEEPQVVTVESDQNGRFCIAGLDARHASFALEAQKAGYCSEHCIAKPGDSITIVLQRPGGLIGRVTIEGSEEPGVGATVSVWGPSKGHSRCGSDGRYRISDLRPGVYQLTVVRRGGISGGKKFPCVVTIAAGQITESDFAVSPGLLVRGRVIGADTQGPIVGAQVGRAGPDWETAKGKVITDTEGRYALDGVLDKTRIRVKAKGYAAFESVIRSTADNRREIDLDICLKPAATVIGQVVGPDGRGVSKAQIYVVGGPLDECTRGTTDEHGCFRIDGLPVDVERRVVAQKEGLVARITESFSLKPGERRSGLLIKMNQGVAVSGQIKDELGTPISQAVVHLRPQDRTAVFFLAGRSKVRPDKDGRFKITGLPEGVYTLEVSAGGFLPQQRTDLVLSSDRPCEHLDFVLVRGRQMTGRVIDDLGRAVERAWVCASWDSANEPPADRQRTTFTDAAGRFALDGLPGVVCKVTLLKRGFNQNNGPALVHVGEGEVVLTMQRAASALRGRVRRADTGGPAGAFFVRCYHANEARTRRFVDRDGSFLIEGLEAGEYYVEAGTDEGLVTAVPICLNLAPSAASPTIDLIVGQGCVLAGRVLTPSESSLPGAEVSVSWKDGPRGAIVGSATDPDGQFRIGGLAPGTYVARASHGEWIEAHAMVTLSPHQEHTIELRLHEQGGEVLVTVRDTGGRPVANVEVVLRRTDGTVIPVNASKGALRLRNTEKTEPEVKPAPSRSPTTRTGPDGVCFRHFVPPGRVVVEASTAGYQSSRIEVEIVAGTRTRVDIVLTPAATK